LLVPVEVEVQLPDAEIPLEARLGYVDNKPVFFLALLDDRSPPDRLARTVACVDYSAGNGGLVAY
jgi:hypothetical protein